MTDVQIPKAELNFSFARSSAPGGQNVNKVNSKAVLHWNLADSAAISTSVKDRFRERFPSRLTDEGDVVIHRVAHRLIVRRGRLAGCIVNQAYQGGGQRLESGTISPEVQRSRVERRP